MQVVIPDWPVLLLVVVVAVLSIWLAIKLYRHDPLPAVPPAQAGLKGIRGWLVLATLNVVAMPLSVVMTLESAMSALTAGSRAALVEAAGVVTNPLRHPLLLVDIAANVALLIFTCLLAILFFRKRISVPRVFIWVIAAVTLLEIFDQFVLSTMIRNAAPTAEGEAWILGGVGVLYAVVWILYFRKSKRVKATFINRREPGTPVIVSDRAR